MRTILVLNAKGGSGKSIIATNLASYYALDGAHVALVDFDPQEAGLEWLTHRAPTRPPIQGVSGRDGPLATPKDTEYLIMDGPAAVHGGDLAHLVQRASTLIIPVLPSPLDIRAAAHFIQELLLIGRVSRREARVAVVANRVREQTQVFQTLERFLNRLKIPYVTALRESQNYHRAAERGLGIFELAPSLVKTDLAQWQPLLAWLNSRRSVPDGRTRHS
ncbi:MAG: chromosome partitioning protein [Chromatiales bacterium 21-64-14]|nr:MAG: chromosome partitioning protein [Chromatiales bacterium 21-64-14]HQU14510.1 AAA family ATPase [Gammaproteobacteria bacterium]